LIFSYVAAFLLTEIIEVAVAILLGYRRKHEIGAVLVVNLLSNPLLNYLLFLNDHYGFMSVTNLGILLLELAVVLLEWAGLVFALRQRSAVRLLFLSAAMNSCSYFAGVLIFG
jgi:hypothetical protein